MSICLLDVNVLVALAWQIHSFHTVAKAWFDIHAVKGWATCPMTQLGFIRVSSNHRIIQPSLSPLAALEILELMLAHPSHVFWQDAMSAAEAFADISLSGYRQVTDAYLAKLAKSHGGRLVTFDRGIAQIDSNVLMIGA